MTKKFIIGLVVLALSITSCITTGDPLDDIVAVDPIYIKEGTNVDPADPYQEAALISKSGLKSADSRLTRVADALNLFFPEIDVIGVTSRRFLVENVPPGRVFAITVPTIVNPITGEVTSDTAQWIGQLLPVVGKLIPAVVPVAGLVTLLLSMFGAKRSRRHWFNALKAFVPTDGNVALKLGYKSIKKAVGIMYTEESAQELLESTVRIAQKEGLKVSVNSDGEPVLTELT